MSPRQEQRTNYRPVSIERGFLSPAVALVESDSGTRSTTNRELSRTPSELFTVSERDRIIFGQARHES
jgi:hypothetical protein